MVMTMTIEYTKEVKDDLEFLSKQANLYHVGAPWGVSDFGLVLEEIVRRYMYKHGKMYDMNKPSSLPVAELKKRYYALEIHYFSFYKEMCKTARKYLEELT